MDQTIILAINHCSNIFMDHVMLRATEPWTWLFMGLVILLLIFKDHSPKQAILVILGVALCILIADQVTSTLIKPMVARLRPCNDPHITDQLRLIAGHGGGYSFPSSHAANNMAVVTFLCMVFRHRFTTVLLYIWALLICYSRMYLGMHYPSDVLTGAVIGVVTGFVSYGIIRLLQNLLMVTQMKYYSNAYTKTGYSTNDMYLLVSAIALTFLYVVV